MPCLPAYFAIGFGVASVILQSLTAATCIVTFLAVAYDVSDNEATLLAFTNSVLNTGYNWILSWTAFQMLLLSLIGILGEYGIRRFVDAVPWYHTHHVRAIQWFYQAFTIMGMGGDMGLVSCIFLYIMCVIRLVQAILHWRGNDVMGGPTITGIDGYGGQGGGLAPSAGAASSVSASRPSAPSSSGPKSSGRKARALADFSGESPEELSFQEGDVVMVTGQDEDGWLQAEVKGKRGIVPATYVEFA